MTAIEVKNLTVSYGDYEVLKDFSLTVEVGEAVLIKGPSGCGKSTLLHAVCGLIPNVIEADCSGEVLIFGQSIWEKSVADRAEKLGIVFQNPETQLFCDSIEDEIAFGLENICLPHDEMDRRIKTVLELTGMESFRHASPKELSGGQKQRVILAAVIALNPQVLLLDEALSQLDGKAKLILSEHLKQLRSEGRTMLMVDHDNDLNSIANRVVEI